jgi:hypothetical protein
MRQHSLARPAMGELAGELAEDHGQLVVDCAGRDSLSLAGYAGGDPMATRLSIACSCTPNTLTERMVGSLARGHQKWP